MIYKLPLHYLAITQTFNKGIHNGIDFGWNSSQDGMNAPIYASGDGIVYAVNDYDKTGKSWGNYVKIKHNETEYTLYAHMKDGLNVRQGQTVKQGDLLGYMGNTGYCYQNAHHLHFEFYKGGAGTNYRVNALDYVYAFDDQTIHPDDIDLIKIYVEPTPEPEPIEDEFKIGDRVCVKGYATSASDGSGEHTAEYGGNPNDESDIRYITLINEGAIRPYHISVGQTQGDGDRGWVSKDQLTKLD